MATHISNKWCITQYHNIFTIPKSDIDDLFYCLYIEKVHLITPLPDTAHPPTPQLADSLKSESCAKSGESLGSQPCTPCHTCSGSTVCGQKRQANPSRRLIALVSVEISRHNSWPTCGPRSGLTKAPHGEWSAAAGKCREVYHRGPNRLLQRQVRNQKSSCWHSNGLLASSLALQSYPIRIGAE